MSRSIVPGLGKSRVGAYLRLLSLSSLLSRSIVPGLGKSRVGAYLRLFSLSSLLSRSTVPGLGKSRVGAYLQLLSLSSLLSRSIVPGLGKSRVGAYLRLFSLSSLLSRSTVPGLGKSRVGAYLRLLSLSTLLSRSTVPGLGKSRVGAYLRLLSLSSLLLRSIVPGLGKSSGSLPATVFSLFLIVKEYSSWAGKIQSGSLPATAFSLFLIVKEYSSWAGKIRSESLPVTAFSLFLVVYNTRAMATHTNLLWRDKVRSVQPCRVWEGSYPGYYIYICQVVELLHKLYLVNFVWVLDKNSNAICLFFSSPAPAPRAICIGTPVAHFDRPFESRPVDSVRQEVFRQLAADPSSSSSSGWFAPSGMLLGSPRPLQPCQETSTEAVPRRKAKRQGRSVRAKAEKKGHPELMLKGTVFTCTKERLCYVNRKDV